MAEQYYMNASIPILTYHQIAPESESCYPLQSVEPETFTLQMKVLSFLGYETIDLDQLHEYRKGKSEIPKNPVIITFDDCYKESIENSVPILKDHGFTAIYYVATDTIGNKSSWLEKDIGYDLPIIDWETVKWLDSNGFHIGGHSASHPHLNQITKEECIEELTSSKHILEEKLGHEIRHLAYPFGSYDESVMMNASEIGYLTACTIEEGLCESKYNIHALPRVNVGQRDSIVDFISKLHTGFSPGSGLKILYDKVMKRLSIQ